MLCVTKLRVALCVALCSVAYALQVVDKHWFERNRHIFPASRWEVFDPEKVGTILGLAQMQLRSAWQWLRALALGRHIAAAASLCFRTHVM